MDTYSSNACSGPAPRDTQTSKSDDSTQRRFPMTMRDDSRGRSIAFTHGQAGPPKTDLTSVLAMQGVKPTAALSLRKALLFPSTKLVTDILLVVFREPCTSASAANYNSATNHNGRHILQTPKSVDSPQHLVTFTTPTAVFAWRRLLPASQMSPDPPVLLRLSHRLHEMNHPYSRSTTSSVQHCTGVQYHPCAERPLGEHVTPPPPRTHALLPATWTPVHIVPLAMGTSAAPRNTGVQNRPYPPSTTGPDTWEKYSKRIRSEDGKATYVCLWRVRHGKREISCLYTSKKQLVKRHILTTHLKYKPFECQFCGRCFPQKADLDIHTSSHTGELPHACKYECGEAFKDPARRHRHHVDVHGYIPKKYKKKYRPPVDLSENDISEDEGLYEDEPDS
ncbi:putative zinc finger protein [Lyophyllum shimeji]|uniref:Zinc finger protein n=1 Tax=Lyophyllum shimeji TaxID=47721 RepID=A0A9P3PE45_LYOSH|nr:putative zinc finger protein [Lyophyllum shimeji]